MSSAPWLTEMIADEATRVRMRAEFWRRVGHAVHRLPRDYPRRDFLLRVAETGNVLGTGNKMGLSDKAGRWAWRRFLVLVDLPAPKVKGGQGYGRPNRDEEE